MHLVLLGDATTHEVHVAGAVPLHLEGTGLERPLLTNEDVEIIIGGVQARVTLGAKGRAEDDEVLGDAGVDDVHRAHRAACVAEHPFGAVGVDGQAGAWVSGGEIGEDVRDHARCVIWGRSNGGELELVEMDGIEDIPLILGSINKDEREETKKTTYLDRVEPAERRQRD